MKRLVNTFNRESFRKLEEIEYCIQNYRFLEAVEMVKSLKEDFIVEDKRFKITSAESLK